MAIVYILTIEITLDAITVQSIVYVMIVLAKIERVEKFYRDNVADTPAELLRVLNEQRERLLKARERHSDYISPEDLEG